MKSCGGWQGEGTGMIVPHTPKQKQAIRRCRPGCHLDLQGVELLGGLPQGLPQPLVLLRDPRRARGSPSPPPTVHSLGAAPVQGPVVPSLRCDTRTRVAGGAAMAYRRPDCCTRF